MKFNTFPSKPLYLIELYKLTERSTFPQGESQAGSPGLLAFHKAKSRSDFLSPGF